MDEKYNKNHLAAQGLQQQTFSRSGTYLDTNPLTIKARITLKAVRDGCVVLHHVHKKRIKLAKLASIFDIRFKL